MTGWNSDQLFSSTVPGQSDCWATPQALFDELNQEFHFDLDAAANDQNTKVPSRYFTPEMDSLAQEWSRAGKSVWLNPPYGRGIGRWIEKAYFESLKGCTVVVLIFARTDTKWWQDWAMKAAQVRLVEGRVHFDKNGAKGPATAPSAILVFSESLRMPQFTRVKLPRS